MVYMYEEDGTPELKRTGLGLGMRVDTSARRLGVRNASIAEVQQLFKGHRRRKKMEAHPTLHGGKEVCMQRQSLLRFFAPQRQALWFCYLPEDRQDLCSDAAKADAAQSTIFYAASVALLLVLSWTMQTQRHFIVCIEWLARFVLNVELAIAVLKYMIDHNMGQADAFVLVVIATVVVLSNALSFPYYCLKSIGEVTRVLSLLYIFVIVYSPAVFLEWMTYYQSFPLLQSYYPSVIGLVCFSVEVVKGLTCCWLFPAPEDKPPELHEKGQYQPMYVHQQPYPA